MEFHLAYSNQIRAGDPRRPFQKIWPDWMAIFSTFEEARLYIQMCAAVDRHKYGKNRNGGYFAHALPFDPPPEQYERLISEDNGDGWKLPSHPWHSLFHYPLYFNNNGLPAATRVVPSWGFETKSVLEYHESLCKGKKPEFGCGDLVYIQDWEDYPITAAVVTGVGVEGKIVQNLADSDIWLGWYEVLLVKPWGCCLEHVHVAECEIAPLAGQVPDNLQLLQRFARHYRGESTIPDEVLERLMLGGISLNDAELFPFHLFDQSDLST